MQVACGYLYAWDILGLGATVVQHIVPVGIGSRRGKRRRKDILHLFLLIHRTAVWIVGDGYLIPVLCITLRRASFLAGLRAFEVLIPCCSMPIYFGVGATQRLLAA